MAPTFLNHLGIDGMAFHALIIQNCLCLWSLPPRKPPPPPPPMALPLPQSNFVFKYPRGVFVIDLSSLAG